MQPLKCLYLLNERDNVATALADLRQGESVPILDQRGEPHGEITLASNAPRFFKVILEDLGEGAAILKWGMPIGKVASPSRSLRVKPRGVVAGTVAHHTNFAPHQRLARFWGDHVAAPSTRMLDMFWESGGHEPYPFEFARTRIDIPAGGRIFDTDCDFVAGFKERMLPEPPPAEPGDVPEQLLGYALEPISAGSKVHLGCLVSEHEHAFPADRLQVEAIQALYRFMKEEFYDLDF